MTATLRGAGAGQRVAKSGPDRRRMLAGSLAMIMTLTTRSRLAQATPDDGSLGRSAAGCGVRFGAAYDAEVFEDAGYAELIRRHSTVTGNLNAFKYDWLRPKGPQADFHMADRILAFAAEARIPFTATTLFWNDYPAPWLKHLSVAELRRLFDAHVDEVVGRYAGRIAAWVVVNEPFAPWDGEPGIYRKGPWYAAFGPGYIERAFRRARAADPSARLILNEGFCERRDDIGAAVRPALRGLARRLLDDGVPVDTIGLQGHIQPRYGVDHVAYGAYLAELADLGLSLEITELDVDDSRMPGDIEVRDRQVAEQYRAFLDQVLAVPRIRSIMTWGISDRTTWYSDVAKAENPVSPRPPRPLPYDRAMQPKPATAAIRAAFETCLEPRR